MAVAWSHRGAQPGPAGAGAAHQRRTAAWRPLLALHNGDAWGALEGGHSQPSQLRARPSASLDLRSHLSGEQLELPPLLAQRPQVNALAARLGVA